MIALEGIADASKLENLIMPPLITVYAPSDAVTAPRVSGAAAELSEVISESASPVVSPTCALGQIVAVNAYADGAPQKKRRLHKKTTPKKIILGWGRRISLPSSKPVTVLPSLSC
jgi:hypothetical protein